MNGGAAGPESLAREKMRPAVQKRFYSLVGVIQEADRYVLVLDGKPVRTPARRKMALPTRASADIVAAEWQAQSEIIVPQTMIATRIVNSALDGVADDPDSVREDILQYAGSDLIFYRAEGPPGLIEREDALWNPFIRWAKRCMYAEFRPVRGIIHNEQPGKALNAVKHAVADFTDPVMLTCLHVMTTMTGSAILALAAARKDFTPQEVWLAANLSEDWNIGQWGEDEEAGRRREMRTREFMAASSLLLACRVN